MADIGSFILKIVSAELKDEPDAALLARFVTARDEAAFTVLVRRHAGMVYRVCRSVLRHDQDAEDACQATFLVLAARAGRVRKVASLASWLHGVALRTGRKMRSAAARRARDADREPPAAPSAADELNLREAQRILHEELDRLPEKYRSPLVLCYLRGLTHDEAAAELGWSLAAFRG